MAEPIPTLTINVDNEKLKETISLYGQLHEIAARYQRNFPGPTPPLNGGAAGGAGAAGGGAGGPGAAGGGNGAGGNGRNNGNQFLNNVNRLANSINKGFGEVNKTIGKTIGMLKGLFESALKWSVRIALIGGGSLFGYDMLARRASQQAMTAQGMNIPTGQMQAAQNVYGSRISGVSGIMSGLAAAQQDVTNPAYRGLLAAGIDPTRGAGENLPQLFQRVAEMTRGMKDTGLAYTTISSRGLGGLISPEMLNQIMANRENLPELAKQYETTSKQLAMPEDVNSSFQKLITIFDTNSDLIANSFKTWASKLNVPIGKLATTFTNAVNKFINGPGGKAVFDTISEGLETFSAWISKPGFEKDLSEFATAVKDIVKAIGNGIIYIGKIIGNGNDNTTVIGAASDQSNPWSIKNIGTIIGNAGESSGRWTRDFLRREAGLKLNWWTFPNEVGNQSPDNEPVQHAQSARRKKSTSISSSLSVDQLNAASNDPNAKTYLNAIAMAEGTAGYPGGGYRTLFGGEQLASLGQHPRTLKSFTETTGRINKTSAAGRYQFTQKTWDEAQRALGLPDFSEHSQDLAALYLIQRRGQLGNVLAGNYQAATAALGDEWASLPSSTYAQHKRTLQQMLGYYDPTTNSTAPGGSQNRVKVDVEVKQTPGSDITAQIAANMYSPIIVPY